MPRNKSIEGFGFVYLEASYFELPIIANRVGGVEDAVIDGKTGLLANPGDINGLTNLIKELVENENLRKRWPRRKRNGQKASIGQCSKTII